MFLVMYIWLTAPTFASDDWRLEVVWYFIDALALMVGYWFNLSSFDIMSSLVVEFTFYWIPFDGMFMIELFWVSTYPPEVLQLVCDCLPYSPFQWPCSSFEGFLFFTFIVRLFSQVLIPKMFIRSRTILPRIFNSIYFSFDWVLGAVTVQLPLEFHPIF